MAGWHVIRVGRSTLPRPPRPGLTLPKASSPSSRANALSAASSNPSLTCNSPSTASSPIPMPIPNPFVWTADGNQALEAVLTGVEWASREIGPCDDGTDASFDDVGVEVDAVVGEDAGEPVPMI